MQESWNYLSPFKDTKEDKLFYILFFVILNIDEFLFWSICVTSVTDTNVYLTNTSLILFQHKIYVFFFRLF